jgi:hypothetical protein
LRRRASIVWLVQLRVLAVRRATLYLTMMVASALLAGCVGTIATSHEAGPETRPVFLLDHGRHSTLLLSRADGSLVRYLYGDWRWYAEGDIGILRAVPTLFAPTPSALGRQILSGPSTDAAIRDQVRMRILALYRLPAARQRIDRLDRRLEGYFERLRDQAYYNAGYAVEFVPGQDPYTLSNNSNHVVAGWLGELGIDVRGNPVFGNWRVVRERN